jgi:hypothetical protein
MWLLISPTQLQQNEEDTISWNLTPHGKYTTSSTYKAQFIGRVKTVELAMIWKTCPPPPCKFFAWLILQNRVWTSDRLASRNWDHNPTCPLCRTMMETAHHLLYSRRVWTLVAQWLGHENLLPNNWAPSATALQWCININTTTDTPRQGPRSLIMLVMWDL